MLLVGGILTLRLWTMKEFEVFKWVLIGQDNSVEQSVVEDTVDCWGSDQETSQGEEKQ